MTTRTRALLAKLKAGNPTDKIGRHIVALSLAVRRRVERRSRG
jgi:hypothetical protein